MAGVGERRGRRRTVARTWDRCRHGACCDGCVLLARCNHTVTRIGCCALEQLCNHCQCKHARTHVRVHASPRLASPGHEHTPPPLFEGEFDYLIWPVQDVPGYPIIRSFPAFVEAIRSALNNGDTRDGGSTGSSGGGGGGDGGGRGGVLVHCASGVSRSPAVVAAYLMATEGLSAADAFASIQKQRAGVSDRKFREQLELWGTLQHSFEKAGIGIGIGDGTVDKHNVDDDERKQALQRLRERFGSSGHRVPFCMLPHRAEPVVILW